jgi:hypothetical protein
MNHSLPGTVALPCRERAAGRLGRGGWRRWGRASDRRPRERRGEALCPRVGLVDLSDANTLPPSPIGAELPAQDDAPGPGNGGIWPRTGHNGPLRLRLR